MDDRFEKRIKQYNLIMTVIAILGVTLIIVSFFVEGSTEKIFEWTGFIAIWVVVAMKFMHPSLSSKNRNKKGES